MYCFTVAHAILCWNLATGLVSELVPAPAREPAPARYTLKLYVHEGSCDQAPWEE